MALNKRQYDVFTKIFWKFLGATNISYRCFTEYPQPLIQLLLIWTDILHIGNLYG